MRARVALSALAMMVVWSGAMAAGKAEAPHGKRAPAASPAALLKQLERAYETKSIELYASLFAADYRFHSSDAKLNAYMTGFDRRREMESARNIFNGMVVDGKLVRPAAERITVTMKDMEENIDPEHADSTTHYIVVSSSIDIKMMLEGGLDMSTLPSRQVLHLVRGDAALLVDGQSPHRNRWYIRRWLDNVDAIESTLAAQEGDCSESAIAGTPITPGPGVLAVRALTNPTCPALKIMCDVPGTEALQVDVFDVMGRLANQREIPVPNPGTLRVEAGAGTQLKPGVYWVRLRQANLKPSTQMVVVAR